MSDIKSGEPGWGDALEAWRRAHWKLGCERLAAYDKRCQDEQRVRRLRKELAAAEAEFATSDAAAKDLQRQVDEMLAAGNERGFRA